MKADRVNLLRWIQMAGILLKPLKSSNVCGGGGLHSPLYIVEHFMSLKKPSQIALQDISSDSFIHWNETFRRNWTFLGRLQQQAKLWCLIWSANFTPKTPFLRALRLICGWWLQCLILQKYFSHSQMFYTASLPISGFLCWRILDKKDMDCTPLGSLLHPTE